MANSFEKLKELDLTREEVDRIGSALKNKEFRKLFSDYVDELQDPKNKKQYEDEITQLEKERGVDVTFIHPQPGYVIKTSVNGSQKGFINICANEHIDKPTSSPAVKEGSKGLQWSLPHSLSPPREDVDNKGVMCKVFDVVFHPDTLHLAAKNANFRHIVNVTACEAVEANFDLQLDVKNLKFPKLQFKGMPRATVVRKPSASSPSESSPEDKAFLDKLFQQIDSNTNVTKKKAKKSTTSTISNYTTPKYIIKHSTSLDMQDFTEHKHSKLNSAIPKELVVEIALPLLRSSSDINVDVTQKTVQLTSENPAKYKLNLTLPYQVNESLGSAKFDKDLKKLIITLPVKRIASHLEMDSGVESDHLVLPGSPDSEVENNVVVQNASEFRTKFLDDKLHYNLPEFTCHVFENVIAFTLNVKNVDETSISKLFDAGSSIHVKFTSVSSGFYPSYYAFFVKLPSHSINTEEVTIETWDNNVILQVPFKPCEKELLGYFYGTDENALQEKYFEEPSILNRVLEEESSKEKTSNRKKSESYSSDENSRASSLDEKDESSKSSRKTVAINIGASSYESSGDELSYSYSPSINKGILKTHLSKRFSVGRSISESSLDDFVCSSFENGPVSLDSVIPEDGEYSSSLKKTVRFNDAVTKQLYRSNSSILGQKKKNQRKAKNKKRANERRHSESEASEVDDKKERYMKTTEKQDDRDPSDIFTLDMDH